MNPPWNDPMLDGDGCDPSLDIYKSGDWRESAPFPVQPYQSGASDRAFIEQGYGSPSFSFANTVRPGPIQPFPSSVMPPLDFSPAGTIHQSYLQSPPTWESPGPIAFPQQQPSRAQITGAVALPTGPSFVPHGQIQQPLQPNLNANGNEPRRESTQVPKKRGRTGKLRPEKRLRTHEVRLVGSCLYHSARKTGCGSEENPTQFDACKICKEARRICYRKSRLEPFILAQLKRLSDPVDLKGLDTLPSYKLGSPYLFLVEMSHGLLNPYMIRLQCTDPSIASMKIDPDNLRPIVEAISKAYPVALHGKQTNKITELTKATKNCIHWHLFRGMLVRSYYASSDDSEDRTTVKCFVTALVKAVLRELQSAIRETFRIVEHALRRMSRELLEEDVHECVASALAALCKILAEMASEQASLGERMNRIEVALANAIPAASDLHSETKHLGHAFWAITGNKELNYSNRFEEMINEAFRNNNDDRILFTFDASASESALMIHQQNTRQNGHNTPNADAGQIPFDGVSVLQRLPCLPITQLFKESNAQQLLLPYESNQLTIQASASLPAKTSDNTLPADNTLMSWVTNDHNINMVNSPSEFEDDPFIRPWTGPGD